MAGKVEYIGAEDEFRFIPDEQDGGGRRGDYHELNQEAMARLRKSEKHFSVDEWNADSRTWLETGDCFYIDVWAFEGDTRVVELKKGCAKELAGEMMRNRARAVEYGGDATLVSTHYNIGFENTPHRDETAGLSMAALGPVYKTLLRNSRRRIGKGIWNYRRNGKRTEFRSHCVMDPEQLEAGIAFLVGTAKGIERLLEEDCGGNLEKAYSSLPIIVRESSKESDMAVLARGLDAVVETNKGGVTVGEIFRIYAGFFKTDLEKFATDDEMSALGKFASGEKPLEDEEKECVVDRSYIRIAAGKKSPREVISEKSGLHGPPGLVGEAVKFAFGKEVGDGLERKTRLINWNGVLFEYRDKNTGKSFGLAIPPEDAGDYLELESSHPENLLDEGRERGWLVDASD